MPIDVKDRIRDRLDLDSKLLSDAFVRMSEIVVDNELSSFYSEEQLAKAEDAFIAILEYFEIKMPEYRQLETMSLDKRLKQLMRNHGIMYRAVNLGKNWYKDAFGVYIGTLKDGSLVALVPSSSGYIYVDNLTGKRVKVNASNADQIETTAVCFYRPFSAKKMNIAEIAKYIFGVLNRYDYIKIAICAVMVLFISMIIPEVNSYVYSELIFQTAYTPVATVLVLLIVCGVAGAGFRVIRDMMTGNTMIKVDSAVSSAVMMRVLSMPNTFFNKYNPGTVANWVLQLDSTASVLVSSGVTIIICLITLTCYILQVVQLANSLAIPAMIITAVQVIFNMIVVMTQEKTDEKELNYSAQEQGFLNSALAGIQKIRLSNSENRVFAKWSEKYKKSAELKYSPKFILKYKEPVNIAIALFGTLLIYVVSYNTGISGSRYMAFTASYALMASAMDMLCTSFNEAAGVPASLKNISALFEADSEITANGKVVEKLSGKIEITNLSFKYSEDSPMVIDDLSMEIEPRSYVAIVGRSGCGKSTLIKLLLGMEKPLKGAIFYGNHDLSKVDIRSLRQRIGTVMQNSEIFPGTIRENITISAPNATEDEIWEAAEMAGIDEDIENMPMGLETIISGESGGISGGQRQRITIARALISKPDILIFDEATSALDNITQKAVVESLDKLKCTRIVVAHRLSTIKTCDRIIMLEDGKITEDGTYDELMALNGKFAELVKRQQV